MLHKAMNKSVPLSGSAPKVTMFCSVLRPIVHPNVVWICSFLSLILLTNQPASQPTVTWRIITHISVVLTCFRSKYIGRNNGKHFVLSTNCLIVWTNSCICGGVAAFLRMLSYPMHIPVGRIRRWQTFQPLMHSLLSSRLFLFIYLTPTLIF